MTRVCLTIAKSGITDLEMALYDTRARGRIGSKCPEPIGGADIVVPGSGHIPEVGFIQASSSAL